MEIDGTEQCKSGQGQYESVVVEDVEIIIEYDVFAAVSR